MAVATVAAVVAATVAAEVAAVLVRQVAKAARPTHATTVTLMPTVVAAMSSRAAICQPLNKPYAAQANARRVVTVVAMAVVTAAQHLHRHAAPVVSLTRCAPAWT